MYKYTRGMYIYTLGRGMYIYTFLMYKYTSYYRENVFVKNIQKNRKKNCVIVHFAEKPAAANVGGRRKIYIKNVYSYIGVKRKKTQNQFFNRFWVLVFSAKTETEFPEEDYQERTEEWLVLF